MRKWPWFDWFKLAIAVSGVFTAALLIGFLWLADRRGPPKMNYIWYIWFHLVPLLGDPHAAFGGSISLPPTVWVEVRIGLYGMLFIFGFLFVLIGRDKPPKVLLKLFDDDELAQTKPVQLYYRALGITLIAAAALRAIPYLYAAAHQLGRIPFTMCLIGFLLALGWSAHLYKQKTQYWYGFTEIIVATLFIIDRCFQLPSVDALQDNWGTLIGAVYFLARGLNNWREAVQKRPAVQEERQAYRAGEQLG